MSEDFSGRTVVVAGLGVSGAAAARVLLVAGARVLMTDAAGPAVLADLEAAGGTWLGAVSAVPDGTDLVVTSPGWRPGLVASVGGGELHRELLEEEPDVGDDAAGL